MDCLRPKVLELGGQEGSGVLLAREEVPVIGSRKLTAQQAGCGAYCLLHKPGPLADAGYELECAISPLVSFSVIGAPSQKSARDHWDCVR